MNLKRLVASLIVCLFVMTNLNASEIVSEETAKMVQEKSDIKTMSDSKPVINGVTDITITKGSSFDAKAGVTATDKEDGDVTKNIQVSGLDKLNTNTVGTYTLKYQVYDSNANITSVNRVVTVINKQVTTPEEKPVTPDTNKVTFSGVSDKSIDYKSKFDSKSGVSAKDSNGKTVAFTVTGKVDTSKPAKYTLTYKAGTTIVTRNITVKSTITSNFKGEKLVTYYKNDKKYKAELFYTSGEKHADYYYNTNGDWLKYVEYHKNGLKKDYQVRNNQKIVIEDYAYNTNGSVKEFIKRYDTGQMKEHAWYYETGRLKRVDNHYSNGRKSMYRTWGSTGVKTDHREYYNQKNNQLKVDYAYHSNGKVSEFIKRYDNGKMKERAWYFYSGQLRKVHNYYSTGRIYMVRYWNEQGVKTDHREYYNQSNTQFKADYAYYDNGKVSEFIKWKSNGKRIEHVWIWKNGDSKNYKRIKRYNSKGQVYSDKSYKDRTVTTNKPTTNKPTDNNNNKYPTDEELAIEIEKEINRVRQEKGVGTLKTDNKVLDGYCQRTVDEFVKTGNPHPGYIYNSPEAVMTDKLLISTNAAWAGGRFTAKYVVQGWTDSPGHYNTQFRKGEEFLDVKVKTTSNGQYVEACYGKTNNP